MVEKHIAAWIQRRIDGWPRTPKDLVMVEWPPEAPEQTWVVWALIRQAMDENRSLLERQAAWDYLLDRVKDYLVASAESKDGQLEDPSTPLSLWSMMVAVEAVKPPRNNRSGGRPSVLGTLHARKILAVVNELVEGPARNQEEAIAWVAEVRGCAEDTIRSALKKAKHQRHTLKTKGKQPHSSTDAFIDNVLELRGEKPP